MFRKILVGKYRELYPEKTDYPYMKDSFQDHPYPGQGKIIYFLMHGLAAMVVQKSCYDVFTGEKISCNRTLMIYGDYEWWGDLAHYVKKYNLRLPSDFERFILKTSSREVYENYKCYLMR